MLTSVPPSAVQTPPSHGGFAHAQPQVVSAPLLSYGTGTQSAPKALTLQDVYPTVGSSAANSTEKLPPFPKDEAVLFKKTLPVATPSGRPINWLLVEQPSRKASRELQALNKAQHTPLGAIDRLLLHLMAVSKNTLEFYALPANTSPTQPQPGSLPNGQPSVTAQLAVVKPGNSVLLRMLTRVPEASLKRAAVFMFPAFDPQQQPHAAAFIASTLQQLRSHHAVSHVYALVPASQAEAFSQAGFREVPETDPPASAVLAANSYDPKVLEGQALRPFERLLSKHFQTEDTLLMAYSG